MLGHCLHGHFNFFHFFSGMEAAPPTRRRLPVRDSELCFQSFALLLTSTNDEQPKAAPDNRDRRIRAPSREISSLEEGEKRTHGYPTHNIRWSGISLGSGEHRPHAQRRYADVRSFLFGFLIFRLPLIQKDRSLDPQPSQPTFPARNPNGGR